MLKPGHKVRTRDGAEAKVLDESDDGEWIRVQYLGNQDDPQAVGTEDLAHKDEVEALLGVVHESTWGDSVTIVLHCVPESEAGESGYEAATMTGVPYGVSINGEDPDSGEGALRRLLDGLKAFGFTGRVRVEDATGSDGIERYEIEVTE